MGNLYQQYYTTSTDITSYMMKKLSINDAVNTNIRVLEPCAGDGVFVNLLLNSGIKTSIDVFELDENESEKLHRKYKNHRNVEILNIDTLLHAKFIDILNRDEGIYDFIIANPPYGAWQDYEKREKLKSIYPDLYIKETYSTFMYLCIHLLKNNGKMVFINPDTYLNLHRHTFLRKTILEKTKIDEISIFPSKFFPNINFGYANLSIISLTRNTDKTKCLDNRFYVHEGFDEPATLCLHNEKIKTYDLLQKNIYNSMDHAFLVSNDRKVSELIFGAKTRIGDIASCVTGFYSGSDKVFIRVLDKKLKNASSYELVNENEIFTEKNPSLGGLTGQKKYIPLIKGGNTSYYKKANAFLDWSSEAVTHYSKDKKARFQNSQFYFKHGIGVPMVSSNKVTASYIDGRLFDQSIVGIFPENDTHLKFLLAFFNSTIATLLLRTINPSANNSANYIKKIPIIIPDDSTLFHINNLVDSVIEEKKKGIDTSEVETIINDIICTVFTENHKFVSKRNLQTEFAFT